MAHRPMQDDRKAVHYSENWQIVLNWHNFLLSTGLQARVAGL
jgi:hypothetical protein